MRHRFYLLQHNQDLNARGQSRLSADGSGGEAIPSQLSSEGTSIFRRRHLLAIIVLVFGINSQMNAQVENPLWALRYGMKNGTLAVHCGAGQKPAAIVRVKEITRDYESKGFFRIGLLPVKVLEGVVFEIYRPESVAASLAECNRWLGLRGAKRLQLREAQFVSFGSTTNRLACGCARPSSNGRWELMEGVTFESGTNRIKATRAILQTTGANAGEFVLATTPPWTNSLCCGAQHSISAQNGSFQNHQSR